MHSEPPSIRLPAVSLATLADRCGALGAGGRDALREAGRMAGLDVHDRLADNGNGFEAEAFWRSVDRELRESGLGRLSYRVVTRDLASIRLADHPEAGVDGSFSRSGTGCHFLTGLLGGLLNRAAGSAVAVLEVECRSDGAASCRFLVGGEGRLREVHRSLSDGTPLPEVLGES